ncbi:hypothetical protein K2173_027840 [Erythroxylum novogranatense]|uniref:Ubiquitin-like domain-containing protein n=1 Tax=Erythroxylum novogranatense TaxID=1862640 RepID=A0AAV8U0F4_9ROSI|nr:hypothetical protein K2173_027840 [Erythroxylum novogranatense]
MADQYSNAGSSTSNTVDGSESSIEINIKTLESQIYSFQVDKNMPVSVFKEKIADQTGVPVGQQRLIFRGKVLKDEHLLSEYQLENGHTLHLVARQPTQQSQPQPSADASSRDANVSDGNENGSGVPRNRIGQISHSVVLGTFNVGDHGEGAVPDINRVIGAVLNSLGIGGQAATTGIGGMQAPTLHSVMGQAQQGSEAGGLRGNVGGQNPAVNQTQPSQASPSPPFQSQPQVVQIPLTAAIPIPSLHSPIPDSLSTTSDFMTRMEQTLVHNGYQQSSSSTTASDLPRTELPFDARGLRTPEALIVILRQAEAFLSGHICTTLAHMARRLEQDGASTDPNVRGQIQTESAQVGLSMQHVGALFLELGRTILTLRMGQSPAESSVNAGPAVYISPSGPNPIMVQPFPLQTHSLFSSTFPPSNPTSLGPVGVPNAPRHVNIHIHAGSSMAPVLSSLGTRGSNGEGAQGERGSNTGSGGSSTVRVLPMRNVIAAAVPSNAGGIQVPDAAEPGMGVTIPQPPSDSSISSLVAEINSQLRSFAGNMQVQPASGSAGNDANNEHSNSMVVNGAAESSVPFADTVPDNDHKDEQTRVCNNETRENLVTAKDSYSEGSSSEESLLKLEGTSENATSSSNQHDIPDGARSVPIGLGLGGLDRKKRVKQLKSLVKNGDFGTTTSPHDHDLGTGMSGRQILQSLASRSAVSNRAGPDTTPSGQAASSENIAGNRPLGEQQSDGQFDAAGEMSQVLQSPALDGLLTNFSEQTGFGSPNMLRNMLQQLTQNPQVMSSVSQIAQQVDSQDLGNMFSGLGSGQGGGIDLSRMVQQMMPVVSQVFGNASATPPPFVGARTESQQQLHEGKLSGDGRSIHSANQIGTEEDMARITGHFDTPGDVFRTAVENAVRADQNGSASVEAVRELSNNEDLANDYLEILQRDVRRRLQGDRGQDKC